MKITPTEICSRLMQSYGIILKEIGGEYILIKKNEGVAKDPLNQLGKALTLTFSVVCTDLLLLNYSDILIDDMNQGFLLTNKKSGSKFSLHKSEYISDEDKVYFIQGFKTLESYISNKKEVIRITSFLDNASVELFEGTFEALTITYSFRDLIHFGNFNLFVGNTIEPLKCYAVEASSKKKFAMIEIDISSEMLVAEEFSYSATIAAKSVIWRYHIINREQVAYSDFKIFSGKNLLTLEEQSQTILANGEKAYILETTNTIAMAERYETFFELEFVKEDLKTGQLLSKKRIGLPVPEINRIKISKNELGYKAYSDMFIYV